MAALLSEPIEIHRDDHIKVIVMDEQGAGGAHHIYEIHEVDGEDDPHVDKGPLLRLCHQEGGIAENGVNGITNEALLAICIHRFKCFQNGLFPSHYNANALDGARFALANLLERTRERKSRNVEGRTVT